MNAPFRRKYVLALAITLALFAAVVTVGVQSGRTLRDNVLSVGETHARTVQIRRVLETLIDLETSQRGYLLTLDAAYLAPYRRAMARIDEELDTLARMEGARPGARLDDVQAVRRLAEAKRGELARTIALAERGDPQAALQIVRSDEGRRLMVGIREALDRMTRAAAGDVEAAGQAAVASVASGRRLAALFSVALAVLLVALWFAMRREFEARQRAEAAKAEVLATLEKRVEERTAAWRESAEQLRVSESRLQSRVERLDLLDQVTRAVGERQDLSSVYQVVLASLEDRLPADGAAVCRHDPGSATLEFVRVGARGVGLGVAEGERVPAGGDAVERALGGALVYEADAGALDQPLPRRLAQAGLNALVLAPLQSESEVLGLLVVARTEARSFSSGQCEFVRQLSAHAALAARQAQLHDTLREAYEQLRQTQEVALQQERLRALGQMASGIAHDINNAIVPAMLYTDDLLERERGLSDEGRGRLRTVSRAIGDVAATVARLSELYRARGTQPQQAAVDLDRLVRQVAELTHARWSDMPQQRGVVIRLRTELAADVPAVTASESEIREALINLVFNAVDAMPEGGEIVVRTRRVEAPGSGASALVEVADTGVGMDEATRRRCAEPFFTTKGTQGTGLGLAMVYAVAQRHQAEVDIRSAPGQGTTVSLRFPAPAPAAAAPAAPTAPAASNARLRILVIDDDALVLETLQAMLGSQGDEVVAMGAGQAGIDAFAAAHAQGRPFSLVFTDLGMPHVDGHQVAHAVKAMSPVTPIVLLTGWGQAGLDAAAPAPVDAVMGKPPKLKELRETLARFRAAAPVG